MQIDWLSLARLANCPVIFCFCRFLYPIYPLICVAASAFIESVPDFFRDRFDPNDKSLLVLVSV